MSKEISLPYKEIGKTPKYHPLPKDFSDALRMVQFSAGTDMTRPVLACIHSDGNIMESCDRFRATRVFMKSELAESFLLPARFVPDLLKYEFSKYGFSKSGGWLHFKTRDGKTMVACRVYQEAEYPNLDSLFSKKGLTGKFKFPDKTSEILERAGVFSESEFAQDEAVTVTINKGQMQVEGKGLHGWHKERSSIKHKGKPIKFSVHPAFLSDCLKLIDVADVGDNRLLMDSKTMKHAVYLMSVEE
jgi:DNA polymerase III sliding clamp (beta) subunit (PCNA family)